MPHPFRQFRHEKLNVYKRALLFAGEAHRLTPDWDSRHAIKDHLPRAAESVVENIAAATVVSSRAQINQLTYSLGSVLECAACLDIARVKELMTEDFSFRSKQELLEIFRMLVGLKNSWSRSVVREDGARYEAEPPPDAVLEVFRHESLEVYHIALDVVGWFCGGKESSKLPVKTFRILDMRATSIVLNIAEGNGRFAELDHRRFLRIAHQSTIKLAAQLDLCAARELVGTHWIDEGKNLLVQVAGMTAMMAKGIEKRQEKTREP